MVNRRSQGRLEQAALAAFAGAMFAAGLALSLPGCRGYEGPVVGPGAVLLDLHHLELFPWTAAVTDTRTMLAAQPGETWSIGVELEVDLRQYLPEMGRFRKLIVAVYGELRYDAEGNYRSGPTDRALSSVFTTTGEPIGRFDPWPWIGAIHGRNGSPFEGLATFELPEPGEVARVHRLAGRIDVRLPPDIQPGWWHPRVALLVDVEEAPGPVHIGQFYDELRRFDNPGLPLVKVGNPATPRIPWTVFSNLKYWGRAGTLPEELRGKVALLSRATFPSGLIVPPEMHPLWPGLPSLFPGGALPLVTGVEDEAAALPDRFHAASRMEVSAVVEGPSGTVDLGTRSGTRLAEDGLMPDDGPFVVDMTRTGTYRVRLSGFVEDAFGRRLQGGGTYVVNVALPLTFSTSCKPGTSFLVGSRYPPKVNVNPPLPARVEVDVSYWPQSDPARKRTWHAEGNANRFGHFSPQGQPLLAFDEPGEYASVVRATYRDRLGRLWMGEQASTGVIAPEVSDITLHGGPSLRDDATVPRDGPSGKDRYAERLHYPDGILAQLNHVLRAVPGPAMPHDQHDSIVIDLAMRDGIELEPLFTIDVGEPDLAERIRTTATHRAAVLPRLDQTPGEPWKYLTDVLVRGMSGHAWTWSPSWPGRRVELPVTSVARGPFHPFAFPQDLSVEAWLTFGIVRPGFPALVGASQLDGVGTFWALNPDGFGNHINATPNGDLPGDVYRVQAGVVVKDRETGVNHYDVYSSVVAIAPGTRSASSVGPVGHRPLVSVGGVDHHMFLAIDTHDAVELGETLGFGGMVFPNVPAETTWTVRSPSGRSFEVRGTADRRGIVRGVPALLIDEPGRWDVVARVRHGDLEGGVVGTRGGDYWFCAAPREPTGIFVTDLPFTRRIDPLGTAEVPLRWPEGVTDVTIHYGLLMPGQVIEQGTVRPRGNIWTFEFTPTEVSVRFSNFDVRYLATGEAALGDTVVMQFCLEGTSPAGTRVHDALRVVLRGDTLMNPSGF